MFYSLNASSRSLTPTSMHAFALCKLHKYQPPTYHPLSFIHRLCVLSACYPAGRILSLPSR